MNCSTNIISAFLEQVERLGARDCACYKKDGRWQWVTWEGLALLVAKRAAGLQKAGLKKGGRAVIFSETRFEWMVADMAVMQAGAVTVPIYPMLPPSRVASLLNDSTPAVAIVENGRLFDVLKKAREEGGWRHDIPVFSMEPADGALEFNSLDGDLTCAPDALPDDPATIVWTSGTTGEEKGVVLTHANLLAEVRGAEAAIDFDSADTGLVCLPLAHVLGRLSQFYPLIHGTRMAFAEGLSQLAENYMELRPSYVVGVPRMLEKVHEQVVMTVSEKSFPLRILFRQALKFGLIKADLQEKKKQTPLWLKSLLPLFDLLVFRRVRARLGGRLKAVICGGAPLSPDIARFFFAMGIPVLEGYGLTESSAAVTVNHLDNFRFGTAGLPLDSVSVRIAPDGEVLLRGPTIFREYHARPADTEAAFDDSGWFRTGDLGELTPDGFLRLTGRKKEMLVTSGGKNIAVQMIEGLMGRSPYISHFMLCGDGKKYLTAVISLNTTAIRDYLKQEGAGDAANIHAHPLVTDLISRHIAEQNLKLANFETVKRFIIAPVEFSIKGGELTPTLKLRREAVIQGYKNSIDALYK